MKKILKKLFGRIYYSYPGYEMFVFLKKLAGFKDEKRYFSELLGYYPDLKNPHSFNEKVMWKKFYDRNPLLPFVSDKSMVRQYVKDVLGDEAAGKILIPLLYETDDPETIPFELLPDEYFIKANHASAWYIIIEKTGGLQKCTKFNGLEKNALINADCSRTEIISACKDWLSRPFGFHSYEWAYQKIKRKIVIEKLLRDKDGKMPSDFKLWVFHGKCKMVQVVCDRYTDLKKYYYTNNWEFIYSSDNIKKSCYIKRPDNLESMIDIAEKLAKPFDFMRVDLYSIENSIHFGELTSYHTSGRDTFNSTAFDFELGENWKIIQGYWKAGNN